MNKPNLLTLKALQLLHKLDQEETTEEVEELVAQFKIDPSNARKFLFLQATKTVLDETDDLTDWVKAFCDDGCGLPVPVRPVGNLRLCNRCIQSLMMKIDNESRVPVRV